MHFARADTYINVYLPRLDGEDPRLYAAPSSPVFNSETTYKFSDQIMKDRRLFLGRKQMSLYEIYYKDNKDGGPETAVETPVEKLEEEQDDTENAEETVDIELDRSDNFVDLPSLKRVSLSLDSKVKRKSAKKKNTRRFNEPLSSYVTNRKKVQTIHTYNPTDTIERQLTSLEMINRNREPPYTESQTKIRTLQRLIKKTQSAPPDMTRTPRSLGLPPIVIGNVGQSTVRAKPPSGKLSYKLTGKGMPVRPSSKPHIIWRQTTEVLSDRQTPRLLTVDMKHVREQPSRIRISGGIFN